MTDRTEKKPVVPSRRDRLKKIGYTKVPKMGEITPENIEVPKVGDLLEKLKEATAANLKFMSFQKDAEQREYIRCQIDCPCYPCHNGACHACTAPIRWDIWSGSTRLFGGAQE